LPDSSAQTLSPCAAARPRCPKCQSDTEVRYVAAARTGFQHWTLRCTRCGLIHEAQVGAGPMKSDAAGWEHSDLQLPQ
jgi:transcription elongation factor Elf1